VPGAVVKTSTRSFHEYVARSPAATREKLREIRAAILEAVPNASETMSYRMPAFAIDGAVVLWIGAFKGHIGFYPGAAAVRAFRDELKDYKTAVGSVQFPLAEPLPLDLIGKIVRNVLSNRRKDAGELGR
jgi:uncharacterized protein YdhG (YjbR/CyaY superfamily)